MSSDDEDNFDEVEEEEEEEVTDLSNRYDDVFCWKNHPIIAERLDPLPSFCWSCEPYSPLSVSQIFFCLFVLVMFAPSTKKLPKLWTWHWKELSANVFLEPRSLICVNLVTLSWKHKPPSYILRRLMEKWLTEELLSLFVFLSMILYAIILPFLLKKL